MLQIWVTVTLLWLALVENLALKINSLTSHFFSHDVQFFSHDVKKSFTKYVVTNDTESLFYKCITFYTSTKQFFFNAELISKKH